MPLAEDLADEVRRLADRLRSLSDTRLARPLPPHASRADAAHDLAVHLAVAGQGVEERAAPRPPGWRTVPRLDDFAVGDQVAVTGTDLARAAAGLPAAEPVWTPAGRRPLGEVVTEAARRLRELRLAL
jgi:hypothetical protein